MRTFKCPDCGASISEDSQFCKYCGAKIDDGIRRSEITINKRIEDVAEIKRADFEERESALRVRKMERELRQQKISRISILILFGLFFLATILSIVFRDYDRDTLTILFILFLIGTLSVGAKIVSKLIKGDW